MPSSAIAARRATALPGLRSAWRAILDAVPAAAYACNSNGWITYSNAQAFTVWGRTAKLRDPRARYCGSHRLFNNDGTPLPHERCWMARALLEDRSYNGCRIVIERLDGSRIHALAYANPVHGRAGQVIGAVNLIAELSPPEKSLRDQRAVRSASPRADTFAIIEVALAVLSGLYWPASAFD
jgi:PAS domain-containing protein